MVAKTKFSSLAAVVALAIFALANVASAEEAKTELITLTEAQMDGVSAGDASASAFINASSANGVSITFFGGFLFVDAVRPQSAFAFLYSTTAALSGGTVSVDSFASAFANTL